MRILPLHHFSQTKRFISMSNQTEKPDVLVSTYGKNAPDAAKFGVGAITRREIEEAAQARRDQRPGGDYRR